MKTSMMLHFRKTAGKVVALLLMLMLPVAGVSQEAVHIPGFYGNSTSLPVIPSNALPTGGAVASGSAGFENRFDAAARHPHQLHVHQESENVIIDWDSFNIGSEAWTHFDQQGNAGWKALNRIEDANPSQIYGRLTADGQVYLINANGILFAPGSQVDVHALVASALNITPDDFLADRMVFTSSDPAFAESHGVVANHGDIRAQSGGSIFLVGDAVENSGTVSVDFGQLALVGGGEVEIGFTAQSATNYKNILLGDDPGTVLNMHGGLLATDQGQSGMYGAEVVQNGIIRSVTALRGSGKIELVATRRIRTGLDSITAAPISDSSETILGAEFAGGQIELRVEGGSAESVIEHEGRILAPSGEVRLEAADRIYLGERSRIDVGGSWSIVSSDRSLVTATLNSQELKDDFLQKGGILQGAEIQFNSLLGSAIGDVSGSILTVENTALDQSTGGGDIFLTASRGDINVREGGVLDFAGGGSIHPSGASNSTLLVSGNRVYDISRAPGYLRYNSILNDQSFLNQRYGIRRTFEGVYAGGANPVSDFSEGYVQGDDAGSLTLVARQLVMDGRLTGGAFTGPYQTEIAGLTNTSGNPASIGTTIPVGGKLIVGNRGALTLGEDNLRNFGVEDVVIATGVPALPAGFNAADDLPDGFASSVYTDADGAPLPVSLLDAEMLSDAGLSILEIFANNGVAIAPGVDLSLTPGDWQADWRDNRDDPGTGGLVGSFTAYARAVINEGAVTVPSGSIAMYSINTISSSPLVPGTTDPNPRFVDLAEGIHLADGSLLSAAGQRVDNSTLAERGVSLTPAVYPNGGRVVLQSEFAGGKQDFVWIADRAVVDVSGGYEIQTDGAISGGDAGLLDVEGGALALEGQLRGFAIEGRAGGRMALTANRIRVVPEGTRLPNGFRFGGPLPEAVADSFQVDDDIMRAGGFTGLSLVSHWDLDVSPGVRVRPSNEKLTVPVGATAQVESRWRDRVVSPDGGFATARRVAGGDRVAVLEESVGMSSLVLEAGNDRLSEAANEDNDTSRVIVRSGAAVVMAPGGAIALEAPQVVIGGSLRASAGLIEATSTTLDLVVQDGAVLSAPGFNRLIGEPVAPGLPTNREALDAGRIVLTSATADIHLDAGALIDVSGAAALSQTILDPNGDPTRFTVAGDAGQLEIRFDEYLNPVHDGGEVISSGDLTGVLIRAGAATSGNGGGLLSVASDNIQSGLDLTAAFGDVFQQAGFDRLYYRSRHSIVIRDPMVLSAGQRITLETPVLSTAAEGEVVFQAPWLTVTNAYARQGLPVPAPGSASLRLEGDWIDLAGSTLWDGFSDITLQASRDIFLQDRFLSGPGNTGWIGKLETPVPLTLQAERVYSATLSEFTVASGVRQVDGSYADGRITILSGGRPSVGTLYSAGGHVRMLTENFVHEGILAAPLGTIEVGNGLGADGSYTTARVYLGESSILSTSGSAMVNYGRLNDIFWTTGRGTTNAPDFVAALPENRILVAGQEVIQREGALLDFSAGGGIFAYEFLPSIDGTGNPLAGKFVVVPGADFDRPGPALDIVDGSGDLPAGRYALLPEAYAFLPGARVIAAADMTVSDAVGAVNRTEEGFALVTGRMSATGRTGQGSELAYFEVRNAAEVLREGFFNTTSLRAENAGALSVRGNTTLLEGTVAGGPVNGGRGAVVDLVGTNIAVAAESIGLPAGFGAADDLPEDLIDQLFLRASFFEGGSIDTVNLGDVDRTATITLASGSRIQARNIHLAASEAIRMQAETELNGTEGGLVNFSVPAGSVSIGSGAVVRSEDIRIETAALTLDGALDGSGLLTLASSRIYLTDNGLPEGATEGLLLNAETLQRIEAFPSLQLISASDLVFVGDIGLELSGDLRMDAARFAGRGRDGGAHAVNLSAQTVAMMNSSGGIDDTTLVDDGSLLVAADRIEIGRGRIGLDGFDRVGFDSLQDTVFIGEGHLTADADLEFTAASMTAMPSRQTGLDDDTAYEVARFVVDAGEGDIAIHPSVASPEGNVPPGGDPGGGLTFTANTIRHDGVIRIGSGTVRMTATGAAPGDGVLIGAGGVINTQGRRYGYDIAGDVYGTVLPGGLIELAAPSGVVDIAAGAVLDVSQLAGGDDAAALELTTGSGLFDAGGIGLEALSGGVSLGGTLLGASTSGRGGAFRLKTAAIDDVEGLLDLLDANGFSGDLDIHAGTGDLLIGADRNVAADNLRLVTDAGSIDVAGTIDVSGEGGGGQAVLFAGGDHLNLLAGSEILAVGTGADADGGEVILGVASPDGWINRDAPGVATQASIDVSGGANGRSGDIFFRAPRNAANDELNVNLSGALLGAENIVVEGHRTYSDTVITSSDINGVWRSEAQAFADAADGAAARLSAGTDMTASRSGAFMVVPGIEIAGDGDLELISNWDLTDWLGGGAPGVVTLRASENLTIDGLLVDRPHQYFQVDEQRLPGMDTWAINLVAGARLDGADLLGTTAGIGELVLSDNATVFTESAPIRFTSGGNTLVGDHGGGNIRTYMVNTEMRYAIGTYNSEIQGVVGGDLQLGRRAAIQTASGDIRLNVHGDMLAESYGAVRTTGEIPYVTGFLILRPNYYAADDGGDIAIRTGGALTMASNPVSAWDMVAPDAEDVTIDRWTASYTTETTSELAAGLVAMGGGNVSVRTGNRFQAPAGTFKSGDLSIISGGNVDGRFLVVDGIGEIHAMGDIGTMWADQSVELFDARMNVSAQGGITLGTVSNTIMVNAAYVGRRDWNLQYTVDAGGRLAAFGGDLLLTGNNRHLEGSATQDKVRVLPPDVALVSSGSIRFANNFYMAPAAAGDLALTAGGNIDGLYEGTFGSLVSQVLMSDLNPSTVYGEHPGGLVNDRFFNPLSHGTTVLHGGDAEPVAITAGGNIQNLNLFLPKHSRISAGDDIVNVFYGGQNVAPSDISLIQAGGSIVMRSSALAEQVFTGFQHGGPGALAVQAGERIDLGTTDGITTVGNLLNFALGDDGSDLYILAGTSVTPETGSIQTVFEQLRDFGQRFSGLLAEGDTGAAAAVVAEARETVVGPFFGAAAVGGGDIDMVRSEIATQRGGGIYIVATGNVNVGGSTFLSEAERENTGINTQAGGEIALFTEGDLNVNESRVMSWQGGNITAWADYGNINAGRGSTTEVSASAPTRIVTFATDEDTGEILFDENGNPIVLNVSVTRETAAVGSGIRTLTFDPDGAGGPMTAPTPGDLFLFAPEGVIDAGEAGIAGRNITLGATEVLNSQNISFSQGSVGVPVSSDTTINVGSLGATSLTETSRIAENNAALAAAQSQVSQASETLAEAFVPKWLRVEVIGFE